MISKNIRTVIFVILCLSVILITLSSFNKVNALSCLNVNITLNNSSSSLCTYQWIKVIQPTNLRNATITAKGIIIDNTFNLSKNSLLNVTKIVNNKIFYLGSNISNGYLFVNYGTVILSHPIFLNFTVFSNYGKIQNRHYLYNGGQPDKYVYCEGDSFPYSYGGSGGAGISNSGCDGGSTLAGGGEAEMFDNVSSELSVVYYNTSGAHVSDILSNYTFNLSALDSAGGGSFNNDTAPAIYGGSGVFPLVIISDNFSNYGQILNNGQSINYSNLSDNKELLKEGVVGAGGGGTVLIISGHTFRKGNITVEGGKVYLSNSLNASLNMTGPFIYNLSNIGNGGAGNVFFFKAGAALLTKSLPNYNFTYVNTQPYSGETGSANQSSRFIQVYLANDYDCNLNSLYVNLSGYYNKTGFSYQYSLLSSDFKINSSDNNLSLKLYGSNPLLGYYNRTENITLSNTTNITRIVLAPETLLPLSINFANDSGFEFYLFNQNKSIFSTDNTDKNYTLSIPAGKYKLIVYNNNSIYNYSIYNSPNCMGYENITVYPGKDYYVYNGLNLSVSPLLTKKIETVIEKENASVITSPQINCADMGLLLSLDKQIIGSLKVLNESILNGSSKQLNYSLFTQTINSTNHLISSIRIPAPFEFRMPILSFNESGFNVVSSSNDGNIIKYSLETNAGNGTINIGYGNRTLILSINKVKSISPFAAFETGLIKVVTYLPSLFAAFLGGL